MKTSNEIMRQVLLGLIVLSLFSCEQVGNPTITFKATVDSASGTPPTSKPGLALVDTSPTNYTFGILKLALLRADGSQRLIFDATSDPTTLIRANISNGSTVDLKTVNALEGVFTKLRITLLGVGQRVSMKTLADVVSEQSYMVLLPVLIIVVVTFLKLTTISKWKRTGI